MSTKTLTEQFGRDTTIYNIGDSLCYMYRSTGEGNKRFKLKFAGTLVPHYGYATDGKTLLKVANTHDQRVARYWQTVFLYQILLLIPSEDILDDLVNLLLIYFNHVGEFRASIVDNHGIWSRLSQTLKDQMLDILPIVPVVADPALYVPSKTDDDLSYENFMFILQQKDHWRTERNITLKHPRVATPSVLRSPPKASPPKASPSTRKKAPKASPPTRKKSVRNKN